MASLQREPTGTFHVVFRFQGARYKRSLETKVETAALARCGEIAETLDLIKRGRLTIPEQVGPVEFILAGGRIPEVPAKQSKAKPNSEQTVTLKRLFDEFFQSIPDENLESNTLRTMRIHQRHLIRLLKPEFPVQQLRGQDLQNYVNARSKEQTQYFQSQAEHEKPVRRKVSACTIRKELVTLGTVWRWATTVPLVTGTFPNRGLRYPKSDEKPPFRTIEEIEYQISADSLSGDEADKLWECVYLRQHEIVELLGHVQGRKDLQPYVYPMIATAAYTGARRSELMRSLKSDLDFTGGAITLRERKRVRGKRSSRRVPMSSELRRVLKEWLVQHPGGPFLFCYRHEFSSETKSVSPDQAHSVFDQAIKGSRWKNLSGWHCLRHSFISNLACKGIDQRIIDDFVGHTTEEMRRRYRHLFPDVKNSAILSVFG